MKSKIWICSSSRAKARVGFKHVGLGPPVDEGVAQRGTKPAKPLLGYTLRGEPTNKESDVAVRTAPVHGQERAPTSPWAVREQGPALGEGVLNTVWVFGFEEAPDVGNWWGKSRPCWGIRI